MALTQSSEEGLKISNAGTNGQYLQKQSGNTGGLTWADVPAGVGGATGVDFNDNVKIRSGTGNDLEIYHDGSSSNLIKSAAGQTLGIHAATTWFRNAANSETTAKFIEDGAVELYYDNVKTFETVANGIKVVAPENNHARIHMWADDGDDGPDKWEIMATTQGQLRFYHGDSSENTIVLNGDGAVELYHDNVKKLETTSAGGTLTGTWTGAGKIKQSTASSATGSTVISSTSWSDTGISLAITPSSTSSKIIVLFSGHYSQNWNGGSNGPQVNCTLYRDIGGTLTNLGDSNYGFLYDYAAFSSGYGSHTFSVNHEDSPNTTSAITYKIYARMLYTGHQMRFSPGGKSSFVCLEVL